MSEPTFNYNVAFTQAVNVPGASTQLSASELWQGIRRGGRNPHDFAEYVSSCEVLTPVAAGNNKQKFRRRLTLANGAVHTAAGEKLDQDVVIAPMLHVEAKTVDTGAKSTFLMSYDTAEGERGSRQLYLTAMYELWLKDVEPGSQAAKDVEINYTALARKACSDAVESIRQWKLEGKLEKWANEG